MDAKAEKVALFRYGLISSLVLEALPRGELTRRAEEIASRKYDIPNSQRHGVSIDTLLHWAYRYRREGFAALAPKPRQDRGGTRVIAAPLAELIERLMHENPYRSGTTLLRELALLPEGQAAPLSASTLYRFLKRRGLNSRQLLTAIPHKKFAAAYSNQLWQSDMLHGPFVERPGGGRMQAFLYATLDDASRLIPHAQFYASQGLDSFLDCLRQAVRARGVPLRLYVDNAKVFRSSQLARIAATLGLLVVHTPPYQPEGRGKIERWFRGIREQFLAALDRRQVLSLKDLNTRLWAWIDNAYHLTEHSALQCTPLRRWQQDIELIRQLPPDTDIKRLFFYRLDRLVRRDCTFLLHKRFYEAPAHLMGKTIEVHFDPLDCAQVELYWQGQPQGSARPVDALINAQLSRDKLPSPVKPDFTGINYVELLVKRKAPEE
jgi:transposase InsO family protein